MQGLCRASERLRGPQDLEDQRVVGSDAALHALKDYMKDADLTCQAADGKVVKYTLSGEGTCKG